MEERQHVSGKRWPLFCWVAWNPTWKRAGLQPQVGGLDQPDLLDLVLLAPSSRKLFLMSASPPYCSFTKVAGIGHPSAPRPPSPRTSQADGRPGRLQRPLLCPLPCSAQLHSGLRRDTGSSCRCHGSVPSRPAPGRALLPRDLRSQADAGSAGVREDRPLGLPVSGATSAPAATSPPWTLTLPPPL